MRDIIFEWYPKHLMSELQITSKIVEYCYNYYESVCKIRFFVYNKSVLYKSVAIIFYVSISENI